MPDCDDDDDHHHHHHHHHDAYEDDEDDDDDDDEEDEEEEEGDYYYDGDGKTEQGALMKKLKLACHQTICQPLYLPYVKSLSPHPATLLQTALRFEAISDLGWCRCTLCRDAPGIRSLASLSLRYM